MELFRRVGLVPALRTAAVPESHPFDVSWVTSMAGHELHRFRYPSVDAMRKRIRETNDGSQPLEPPMRVSQVEIEPVLLSLIHISDPILLLAYDAGMHCHVGRSEKAPVDFEHSFDRDWRIGVGERVRHGVDVSQHLFRRRIGGGLLAVCMGGRNA